MKRILYLALGLLLAISMQAQTPPCNTETFLKTFGSANPREGGLTLCPSGDGNLYASGARNRMSILMKLTPSGEVLWSRAFNPNSQRPFYVNEMFVDSDGMLVAAGLETDYPDVADTTNFFVNASLRPTSLILRYDPAGDAILWSKRIQVDSVATNGIIESSAGGNYIFYQSVVLPNQFRAHAEVMQLDRATGNAVAGQTNSYVSNNATAITRMVSQNGALYGVGAVQTLPVPVPSLRTLLTRLNSNGSTAWANATYYNAAATDLLGTDLLIDGDTLVTLSSGANVVLGGGGSLPLGPVRFYVQKNTTAGNLVWLKQYEFGDFSNVYGAEIVKLGSGYAVYGIAEQDSLLSQLLVTLDQNGNVTNASTLSNTQQSAALPLLKGEAIVLDGHLFTTGGVGTDSINWSLVKTNEDLVLGDSCGYLQATTAFTVTAAPAPFATNVTLQTTQPTVGMISAFIAPLADFPLEGRYLCPAGADTQMMVIDTIRVCSGDSINLNGVVYTQNTLVTDTLPGGTGGACDTLVQTQLIFQGGGNTTTTVQVCQGSSITIGGVVYTQSGTVVDTVGTGGGACDSTITYILVFTPQVTTTNTITFPMGGSVTINGVIYTIPTTIVDTLSSTTGGCDTISTTILQFEAQQPCNTETFLKTYGSANPREAGLTLCPSGDGNMYASGARNRMSILMKLTPSGDVIWSRAFNPNSQRPFYVNEMFVDSDGMLVAAGLETDYPDLADTSNLFANASIRPTSLVLRYNPNTSTVLWSRRFNTDSIATNGIVQSNAGGNYTFYQSVVLPNQFTAHAEVMTLDRATGNVVAGQANSYVLNNATAITRMVASNGSLYAVGATQTLASASPSIRTLLARFDNNGSQPTWSNVTYYNAAPVDLVGTDLLVDNNTLVTLSVGSNINLLSGGALPIDGPVRIYLQKNSLDGNLMWMKQYEFSAFSNVYGAEVVRFGSGYAIYGVGERDSLLSQLLVLVDQDGNFVRATNLANTQQSAVLPLPKGDAIALGGNLFATGGIGADSINWSILKTNEQLTLGDSCGYLESVTAFNVTNSPNAGGASVTLQVTALNNVPTISAFIAPFANFTLESRFLCPVGGTQTMQMDTIQVCSGTSITIGGVVFTQDTVVIDTLFAGTGSGCDTLVRTVVQFTPQIMTTNTITFPMGGSVIINGVTYTMPTTITVTLPGNNGGCDTISTIILQFEAQQPCNTETFLKTFGSANPREAGLTLCPSGDGNMYASGARNRMSILMKLTPSGDVIWSRAFNPNSQRPFYVNEMFVDSDGMLVAAGLETDYPDLADTSNLFANASIRPTSLVLRYNPNTSTVLWSRRFNTDSIATNGIVQGNAGGNYTFYQSVVLPNQFTAHAEVMTLDRATGSVSGANSYALNNATGITRIVQSNGSLYAVGAAQTLASANPSVRTLLARFDNNGSQPTWSNVTYYNAAPVDLVGTDLLVDNNTLVTLSVGANINLLAGGALPFSGPVRIYLQKNSLDGNLMWMKQYESSAFSNVYGAEVVRFGTGYAIYGVGERDSLLSQLLLLVDQDGNFIRAKNLTNTQQSAVLPLLKGDAIALGGNLFATGGIGADSINWSILKTNEQLTLGDSCGYLDSIGTFNVTNSPNAGGASVTLQVTPINNVPTISAFIAPFANFTLESRFLCPVGGTQTMQMDTVQVCSGTSITIGGVVFTQDTVVIDTLPATTGSGCDTIVRIVLQFTPQIMTTDTIFFPIGGSVTINGVTYNTPTTIIDTLPSNNGGCDTIATTVLQFQLPLTITCQGDVTVTAAPTATGTVVDYLLPTVTSGCPSGTNSIMLISGLPGGAIFPVGVTTVCYQVSDNCGNTATCCFNVTVLGGEMACDTKTNGCFTWAILPIRLNQLGERRYRIKVTNNCAQAVNYVLFQVPDGVTAVAPANNSTYTAIPSGRTYLVRNPNFSPFYSVRFKADNPTLVGGASDIFEYTLPQQSVPQYIHTQVKFVDGTTLEAFLNTFNCPIVPFMFGPNSPNSRTQPANYDLGLYPNPTDGQLLFDLAPWEGQPVQVDVINAQGRLVQTQKMTAVAGFHTFNLNDGLPSGLYHFVVRPSEGVPVAQPFVLERN